MGKNILLILAFLAGLILVINGTKRILSLRTTSQEVGAAEERLNRLKEENKVLTAELEYKKSNEFVEQEIRNKLGYVKEGEAVVLVPKEEIDSQSEVRTPKSEKNWRKWWRLFFGS